MKFYHGTNKHGLKETKKQGFLLHRRLVFDKNGQPSKIFKPSPCTYLAIDRKEAKRYGNIVLEVEYDPIVHPNMNNYIEGCWQLRVYEPIYHYKTI